VKVIEIHKIDIKNCRGQAYDTTASMNSSSAGVQAHIKKHAPDAEFQGCYLQSEFGNMQFIADSSCPKHD
jgi:hypothetical protein